MTNEEAIDELSVIYERLSHPDDCGKGVYYFSDGDYLEALEMAIKALEALDKLDVIIVEQLDESTDQKECMTLRWVLDKMSEVI